MMSDMPENVQLEIDPNDDNHTRNVKALYNRLNEMEWKMGELVDVSKSATQAAHVAQEAVNELRTLMFHQRAELENRITDQERKIASLEGG